MAEDYNLSMFYLPTSLLIYDQKIVGYESLYFPNNIIKFGAPYNGNIKDMNIPNLLKAREKLIKEARILTKDKIVIMDLTFNLLFDNEKLGAIDTFGYYYDPNVTLDDNIDSIDYAILHELHYHDIRFEQDYDLSVEKNLKRIRNKCK